MAHTASGRTSKKRQGLGTVMVPIAQANPGFRTATKQRRKRQTARTMRRFESAFTLTRKALGNWQTGRVVALPGFSGWPASKALSLLLLAGVAGLIYWATSADQWFIEREDVTFTNVSYLQPAELYQAAGVNDWNTLWLQPTEIRQRLLSLPFVADATVEVQAPGRIQVTMQETQPTALWVTEDATLWLMPSGLALAAPAAAQGSLLRIVDGGQEARALDTQPGTAMDRTVLSSALALAQQFPGLSEVRYNRDYGLNFHAPQNEAWVYWGDGNQMEQKLANLAAVQKWIEQGEVTPQIIDVRYERPYIR
jgi:cell division septal protein FtsQ